MGDLLRRRSCKCRRITGEFHNDSMAPDYQLSRFFQNCEQCLVKFKKKKKGLAILYKAAAFLEKSLHIKAMQKVSIYNVR